MIYLITTDDNIQPENVTCLSKLSDLSSYELLPEDIVIFHSTNEDELEISLSLNDLTKYKTPTPLFYVNEVINSGIETLIKAQKGIILEDEYYLSNPQDLYDLGQETGLSMVDYDTQAQALIDNLSSVKDVLVESGDFALALFFQKTTDTLKQELVSETDKNNELAQYLLSFTDNTSKWVTQAKEEKDKWVAQIEDLTNSIETPNILTKSTGFHFPNYRYTFKQPLLLFKEYSNTRYLTSFVLALREWLEAQGKLTRVVLIDESKGTRLDRYKDFAFIDRDTYNQRSENVTNPVGVIQEPFKASLDFIFSQGDKILLVIDRTYRVKPFITGQKDNLFTYYAYSGLNEYLTYTNQNLTFDKLHSLVPIIQSDKWTTLQHLKQYPTSKVERINKYHIQYADLFRAIYDEFKLQV